MNFETLNTQGYTVVKNFLSSEQIQNLLTDYQNASRCTSALFSELGIVQGTPHNLENLFTKTFQLVRQQTDIKVDFCFPCPDFFNNSDVGYGYHQDHEPYCLWQNSFHGLNVWIPLVKKNSNEDGLKVIPMDKLGKHLPLFFGKGARFIFQDDKGTLVQDDCLGTKIHINLQIDDLAIVPEVGPGDALIFRADVIHASQPKKQHRVAASIRCMDTQTVIKRSVAYSWANNYWKSYSNSVLYYSYFQKLDRAFKENENVLAANIVLTQ